MTRQDYSNELSKINPYSEDAADQREKVTKRFISSLLAEIEVLQKKLQDCDDVNRDLIIEKNIPKESQ